MIPWCLLTQPIPRILSSNSAHSQSKNVFFDVYCRKKKSKFKIPCTSTLCILLSNQKRICYRTNTVVLKHHYKKPFVSRQNSSTWKGRCLDTGIQTTVIVKKLAKSYCRYMGLNPNQSLATTSFGFEVTCRSSLGQYTSEYLYQAIASAQNKSISCMLMSHFYLAWTPWTYTKCLYIQYATSFAVRHCNSPFPCLESYATCTQIGQNISSSIYKIGTTQKAP